MPILRDCSGFFRFATGLKRFVREPISIEKARALVEQGVRGRAGRFLEKVEKAIFANPTSPYLALLRHAGCELGDIQKLVKQDGVEGALEQLRQAGVYVTYEEFKGRVPIVRGSERFTFDEIDFDNPLITTHYRTSSGGTSGTPTRIRIDLEHIAQSATHWALWFAAHDLLASPLVFWTCGQVGLANRHLMCAKFGKRFVKWFVFAGMSTLKDRMTAAAVHAVVRRAAGVPKPEPVSLNEAERVGEYLVGMVRQQAKPCINTSPSAAVRISLAMQARGVSLHGVTFLLGGEPQTQIRKETIEACGAKAVVTYGFSEGGSVGSQCTNPSTADEVHVSADAYAVIQHARNLGDGMTVDALLLTALRPACPKVLFNTEIGDSAVMETKRCGCLFDELGYHQHLHTIRSFNKLTGEGMTFVGSDLFAVLEDVFPKKFGGTVGDYQLIEKEDEQGLPCYRLLVSPAVGAVDEKAMVAALLDELGKLRSHYRYMAKLWDEANTISIERCQPVATARGKVPPFRTLRRG